ncbi:metallophosphoesterase [Pelagibacterium sp. H642]|uniref:metallophosphoesterase family protein n=1 Tax=Pelagibacterium sp. H642 TaxID=1881069 RepID=UPI00281537C1|nr:metallophosphoesterase [Pelagibacterium sp. H642]WMT90448.1 metallophosphoesterase [Pelagibacterium sp. H642]
MKIAVVTDIHHGPQSHNKLEGWNGLPVLERFLTWAEGIEADLVLDLGDHISDVDRDADVRHMREVAKVFASTRLPRMHVLGNHDVVNLAQAESEDIFEYSMASRITTLADVRIIAWQPDVHITRGVGFCATGEHLDWLIATLEADERPALVATHVPVSGHAQTGNYYFETRPEYSTYPDHARVRQAVEGTGKVAAWFSGHVHWNTISTINGLRHVTIQSMSERFTSMPDHAEAYGLIEIAEGALSTTVYGNDPFHVQVPFRPSGQSGWLVRGQGGGHG